LMEFTKLKYIAKEATIEMQQCIKDLYHSALINESIKFRSLYNKDHFNDTCKDFISKFLDCSQPYNNQDYSSSCHIFTKDHFNSDQKLWASTNYFDFNNLDTLQNCFSALAFFIFNDRYLYPLEKRLIISDIISLYDDNLDDKLYHEKLIKTVDNLSNKYNDPLDVSILSKFEALLDTLKITEPTSTQLSEMILDMLILPRLKGVSDNLEITDSTSTQLSRMILDTIKEPYYKGKYALGIITSDIYEKLYTYANNSISSTSETVQSYCLSAINWALSGIEIEPDAPYHSPY
jgi:hypothetical protein